MNHAFRRSSTGEEYGAVHRRDVGRGPRLESNIRAQANAAGPGLGAIGDSATSRGVAIGGDSARMTHSIGRVGGVEMWLSRQRCGWFARADRLRRCCGSLPTSSAIGDDPSRLFGAERRSGHERSATVPMSMQHPWVDPRWVFSGRLHRFDGDRPHINGGGSLEWIPRTPRSDRGN